MIIGFLIADTIFVQVVLLLVENYLFYYLGEYPLLFLLKECSSGG